MTTLYHFTATRFLEGIKRDGLTKGVFPIFIDERLSFLTQRQWLTKREGFDQPWHDPEFTKLPYDRRQNRLTIEIPKSHRSQIQDWDHIKRTYGKYFLPGFDSHEDCANWVIYLGRIKPKWIKEIVNKKVRQK